MNPIDIQAKLAQAFERNEADDSVLCDHSSIVPTSPLSAVADNKALSPECLDGLLRSLADTSLLDHKNGATPLKAVFSYDGGMEMSFFGTWGLGASGGEFLRFLRPLKEKAKELNAAFPFVFCGLPFNIMPSGVRSGAGSYSFVLTYEENGRLKYRFYIHTSPCDTIPGVRVLCSYQAFRRDDPLSHIRDELLQVLSVIGFNIDRSRLSRIDFNLTINHSINHLVSAFHEDRIINRCSDVHIAGGRRNFKSYRIGNHNTVQFAVYDKIKELSERYDADKINDLSKFLDPKVGDSWTRYEFRLGRSFLHSVKIESLQDFIENQLAIVNFLTYNWFSVIETPYRKGRKKYYKVSSWWQQVRLSMIISVLSKLSCVSLVPNTDGAGSSDLALNLNIIRRYRFDDKQLPVVSKRPRRLFRKCLKRVLQMSVGCMATAVFLSLPSGEKMDFPQFEKAIKTSLSYFIEQGYERYNQKFDQLMGVERSYTLGANEEVLPLLGGCHA